MQRLQEEAQWLMVVEYVRALMQKRLVCRSGEERRQLAQQMLQDDQLFREIFHSLVGIKYYYTIHNIITHDSEKCTRLCNTEQYQYVKVETL